MNIKILTLYNTDCVVSLLKILLLLHTTAHMVFLLEKSVLSVTKSPYIGTVKTAVAVAAAG